MRPERRNPRQVSTGALPRSGNCSVAAHHGHIFFDTFDSTWLALHVMQRRDRSACDSSLSGLELHTTLKTGPLSRRLTLRSVSMSVHAFRACQRCSCCLVVFVL